MDKYEKLKLVRLFMYDVLESRVAILCMILQSRSFLSPLTHSLITDYSTILLPIRECNKLVLSVWRAACNENNERDGSTGSEAKY